MRWKGFEGRLSGFEHVFRATNPESSDKWMMKAIMIGTFVDKIEKTLPK
jgi:hypothetical protein